MSTLGPLAISEKCQNYQSNHDRASVFRPITKVLWDEESTDENPQSEIATDIFSQMPQG
jgi:hypothetical protein